MHLTYRGTHYQPTTQAIATIETDQTGFFRGACFQMRQPNLSQRHPSSKTALIYRGVSYMRP